MANFRKCYLAVSLVVAFFSVLGFMVMVTNTTKCSPLSSINCPAGNGYPAIDRYLPDLARPSSSINPGNLPDISLDSDSTAIDMSNTYKSAVKKSETNNFQKPQGRMFPLTTFPENDEEAIPGIPEKMITTLSSMVFQDSHPIIEEKMKSNENRDFEAKMTTLMSSIISSETNPTVKWNQVNTLSDIVSTQGIEPDIRKKMNQVLHKIVAGYEMDQKLKLRMAKLISAIITQDTDESVKWKLLNTLLKIASQKTEMEIKSKLITIFSAITNEKYSPETHFKTATSLSTIVDRYGIDVTRTEMEKLLSRIVPPEAKIALLAEPDLTVISEKNNSLGSGSDIGISSENTQEDDQNKKVEMINILSKVVSQEKALKVASDLIEFTVSVDLPKHPQIRTSLANILSRIVSVKGFSTEIVTETKNHTLTNIRNLDNEIDNTEYGMSEILLGVVTDDREAPPEANLKEESESLNMFLNIIHEDEAREAELTQNSETNGFIATLVDGKKKPGPYFHQESTIMNISLDITHQKEPSVVDTNKKAEMLKSISNMVKEEKAPEEDPDDKSGMVNIVLEMVHQKQPPEVDLYHESERINTFPTIIQEGEIGEAQLDRSGMIEVFSNMVDEEKEPGVDTEKQLDLIHQFTTIALRLKKLVSPPEGSRMEEKMNEMMSSMISVKKILKN